MLVTLSTDMRNNVGVLLSEFEDEAEARQTATYVTLHVIKAESVEFRAWRQHTRQKLNSSFTKPALNKKIDDVRHRNQAFLAISQQIVRFSISWGPNQSQRDLQYADKDLEKTKRLREASKTLYGHL